MPNHCCCSLLHITLQCQHCVVFESRSLTSCNPTLGLIYQEISDPRGRSHLCPSISQVGAYARTVEIENTKSQRGVSIGEVGQRTMGRLNTDCILSRYKYSCVCLVPRIYINIYCTNGEPTRNANRASPPTVGNTLNANFHMSLNAFRIARDTMMGVTLPHRVCHHLLPIAHRTLAYNYELPRPAWAFTRPLPTTLSARLEKHTHSYPRPIR
jgi:hypothetical protein